MPIIVRLIKQILSMEKYPEELKIAKVTPIHKKGDQKQIINVT